MLLKKETKAKDKVKEKTSSNIVVYYLRRGGGALVDKITVNTDMANLSTAVSIRSFNPGPDR